MGARATNSHKLEMLDRPINTMFPVAYDRRRISEEKAWRGRRVYRASGDRNRGRTETVGAWGPIGRNGERDENYWSNTEKAAARTYIRRVTPLA